jgi:hypothetical protein
MIVLPHVTSVVLHKLPMIFFIVIQFGYVTLFVIAWPLAPAAALLSNYVSWRLAARKLANSYRRPFPKAATAIGSWFNILNFMSYISLVMNILLVTFYTETVANWTKDNLFTQVLMFTAIEVDHLPHL